MKGEPEREVAAFTKAIHVPAQERAAFLERECAGDENLLRKVEALLRAHDRLGNFLAQPAVPETLVRFLHKIARRAPPSREPGRKGPRKAETSLRPQVRKRKGRIK